MARGKKKAKSVATLTHDEASRRNIPTAEYHPVMADENKAPVRVAYGRRNRDLDTGYRGTAATLDRDRSIRGAGPPEGGLMENAFDRRVAQLRSYAGAGYTAP